MGHPRSPMAPSPLQGPHDPHQSPHTAWWPCTHQMLSASLSPPRTHPQGGGQHPGPSPLTCTLGLLGRGRMEASLWYPGLQVTVWVGPPREALGLSSSSGNEPSAASSPLAPPRTGRASARSLLKSEPVSAKKLSVSGAPREQRLRSQELAVHALLLCPARCLPCSSGPWRSPPSLSTCFPRPPQERSPDGDWSLARDRCSGPVSADCPGAPRPHRGEHPALTQAGRPCGYASETHPGPRLS